MTYKSGLLKSECSSSTVQCVMGQGLMIQGNQCHISLENREILILNKYEMP